VTLVVSELTRAASPYRAGWTRLAARVRSDVDTFDESWWLEVADRDADALHLSGDAFLVWLAPVSALRREPVRLEVAVDRELLEQVREVQRVWQTWFPECRAVTIDAPTTDDITVDADAASSARSRAERTASFFTGGVDSFFTALRHDADEGTPRTVRIDDLIFVHGFDVPLGNERAAAHVITSLAQAAASLGKPLVVVRTNLRETAFGRADWPRHSHGAALAGVAHALGARYHTVLLGSSAGYGDLRFWGSHPMVDPMFHSTRLRVLHDGPAFMRVQKTEYVVRSPIARAHLRVCWKSEAGDNCGRCNNCYRTMLALECLGVLDDCATFDRRTLDLSRVARIYCRHDYDVRQFGYVRDLARREGRRDVAEAVERALADSETLRRRLAFVQRLRDRRIVWRWARAWEARLMRGWID
jgi:hypothetical protein